MGEKKIAIVGGGAKAAAIVARAATLRGLGKKVPEIVVFEKDHVGSAWSGQSGFSNGFLTLCTPGEKDVGYPYHERTISPALFARFSWSAYLVAERRMSRWVDRGRDHPDHRYWADYLQWVFRQAGQEPVIAEVKDVTRSARRWQVSYDEGGTANRMLVDGVVLTGTGPSRRVPSAPGMPAGRALDAEKFWPTRQQMSARDGTTIIVVGNGGAAGTIVAWLVERYAERDVSIISVNPLGTLFPRGDGYAERRWFSDPSNWPRLRLEHRRTLIERTEAGVVSLRVKHLIDTATSVDYKWGRATKVHWDSKEAEVVVDVEYAGQTSSVRGDYVISAIGFDAWSLLRPVNHPAVASLLVGDKPRDRRRRERVEAMMTPTLALPTGRFPAGLHVPGLAGLAQGPGMGNLGCLGLMADCVLSPYVVL